MAAVHLSFDNGPHPDVTPFVLDTLAKRGIKASFFVLGKHLATDAGRALARRTAAEGHRLANHSYTHETPLGLDPRPDAVARELADTQALLDPLWHGPRWFRPFGGGGVLGKHLLSPAAVDWLCAQGHTAVLWNSVPGDWLDADGWVDVALADADRLTTDVVVLHDILPDAMRHLPRFLDTLADRGHTFTDHLPAELTPIVAGQAQPGLAAYVQDPTGATDDR